MDRSKKAEPHVHVFSTFFYPRLLKVGHKGLARWTKKVGYLDYQLFLKLYQIGTLAADLIYDNKVLSTRSEPCSQDNNFLPCAQVDLFAMDVIMVPIHLGMHWCLAAIDIRAKTVTYYDSLLGDNQQCVQALR